MHCEILRNKEFFSEFYAEAFLIVQGDVISSGDKVLEKTS